MTKKQKNKDKKISLIYNPNLLFYVRVKKIAFETIGDAEDYINRFSISKSKIEYLGEYKPIKRKIVIG